MRAAAPYQGAVRRPAGYERARRDGFRHRSDKLVSPLRHRLDVKRVLRAVPERGAYSEHVFLDGLWLDHTAGPYGFEQLIVRDQAPSVID
jgi:hypothetical protein